MNEGNAEKNRRDLFRIMSFSTALGFGAMGGLLCSIREIRHHFTVALSFWTLLGFLAGGLLGWGFWRVVRRLDDKSRKSAGRSKQD